MATTHEEIDSFSRFAKEKLDQCGEELSMEDMFDLWRIENPNPEQLTEDVLAVKVAIRDLNAGDRGVPLDQHLRDVRAKYNLPDE